MDLFLIIYFYLSIWRLRLFSLFYKRKIESQEFKVFMYFMKTDFSRFFCFFSVSLYFLDKQKEGNLMLF